MYQLIIDRRKTLRPVLSLDELARQIRAALPDAKPRRIQSRPRRR
jgi:hypothetical protein